MREYQSRVRTEKQSEGERENDKVRNSDKGRGRQEAGRGEREEVIEKDIRLYGPPLALTPHSSQLWHYPLTEESLTPQTSSL